ncbi:uncharacterized protein V6R79_009709 [Siganus canaliculatus]
MAVFSSAAFCAENKPGLSDFISVTLLSSNFAWLSFRCKGERVQLPLSVLSSVNKPKEMVPVCSWEVAQMAREVKVVQESSEEEWIKCPDRERMPGAPLRTRWKRELQFAALGCVSAPELSDVKTVLSYSSATGGRQHQQEDPWSPASHCRGVCVQICSPQLSPQYPASLSFSPSALLLVIPALLRAGMLLQPYCDASGDGSGCQIDCWHQTSPAEIRNANKEAQLQSGGRPAAPGMVMVSKPHCRLSSKLQTPLSSTGWQQQCWPETDVHQLLITAALSWTFRSKSPELEETADHV